METTHHHERVLNVVSNVVGEKYGVPLGAFQVSTPYHGTGPLYDDGQAREEMAAEMGEAVRGNTPGQADIGGSA
jgi:hypothetical protein